MIEKTGETIFYRHEKLDYYFFKSTFLFLFLWSVTIPVIIILEFFNHEEINFLYSIPSVFLCIIFSIITFYLYEQRQWFTISNNGIIPYKKPLYLYLKGRFQVDWSKIIDIAKVDDQNPRFLFLHKDLKDNNKYWLDILHLKPNRLKLYPELLNVNEIKKRCIYFATWLEYVKYIKNKGISFENVRLNTGIEHGWL